MFRMTHICQTNKCINGGGPCAWLRGTWACLLFGVVRGGLAVIICYSHLWLWGRHQGSGVERLERGLSSGWLAVSPRCTPNAVQASLECVRLTQSSHLQGHTHTIHTHVPACMDTGGFNLV